MKMATILAIAATAFAAFADETGDMERTESPHPVLTALAEKYGSASLEQFTCAEAANAVVEYAANPESGELGTDLDGLKRQVLRSALRIMKRALRDKGRTFVLGPDGTNPVQTAIDALSAALNAPRMSGVAEWVAEWCPAGHTWVSPTWMTAEEIEAYSDPIFYGDRDFGIVEQMKLCAAMGVADYNSFVGRYNGGDPEPAQEEEPDSEPTEEPQPEEPQPEAGAQSGEELQVEPIPEPEPQSDDDGRDADVAADDQGGV